MSEKFKIVVIGHALILPVILLFAFCSGPGKQQSTVPYRIISLGPGITESLFAMGLGDRVTGVTSYCKYPARARGIEIVGGYLDANVEKIISMRPDLVIAYPEHEKQRAYLGRFGVNTLVVSYSSIADICSSFAKIGRACGIPEASDSLVAAFSEILKRAARHENGPRVLLCAGRDSPGSGYVRNVYAAGITTFYNELILAAGGVNAVSDSFPQYPCLSEEGVMTAAPDIIIDMAPAMDDVSCGALSQDWVRLKRVAAVANRRVYCVARGYATIPGPRLLMFAQELAKIVSDTSGSFGEL